MKSKFGEEVDKVGSGILCGVGLLALLCILICTFCSNMFISKFTNVSPYYSPVYADNITYTAPPGECAAMRYSPSNVGTECGGWLPLQGNVGEIIAATQKNNHIVPNKNSPGMVGGIPNQSDCKGPSCYGMQPFGMVGRLAGKDTNSYYLTGANVRGTAAGQKNPNCDLPVINTWPSARCQNGVTLTDPNSVYGTPKNIASFAS